MKKLFFVSLCCLCISACNDTNKTPNAEETLALDDTLTTAEAIAERHGIRHWDSIQQLEFTFNVARDTSHFERSWRWYPKKEEVTLVTSKDSITYSRKALDSTLLRTDAAFINDSYWLLAPFKLVWDDGIEFSEEESVVAPISKDTLHRLTITYVGDGGYTPGDAYDFYYDDRFTVREWVFRKGNDSVPSMITTWKSYENVEGLMLATVHTDSLRKFKLYFTDVSAKK
jgi:hypothetical protein